MAKFLLTLGLLPLVCCSQNKEKWIENPKEQWPKIALINKVKFRKATW